MVPGSGIEPPTQGFSGLGAAGTIERLQPLSVSFQSLHRHPACAEMPIVSLVVRRFGPSSTQVHPWGVGTADDAEQRGSVLNFHKLDERSHRSPQEFDHFRSTRSFTIASEPASEKLLVNCANTASACAQECVDSTAPPPRAGEKRHEEIERRRKGGRGARRRALESVVYDGGEGARRGSAWG